MTVGIEERSLQLQSGDPVDLQAAKQHLPVGGFCGSSDLQLIVMEDRWIEERLPLYSKVKIL